ncbi:MAG: hypothetical protein HY290_19925 [Planctomycetia bacterium]|nr:hypothetical protein [Planctomycetia bacterium]
MIAEGPGVRLGQVQMNEVIVSLQEFSNDAGGSDEDAFDGRESSAEGPARITQGTPDEFVFGESATAAKAEIKLYALLEKQVARIDRMCKLTDEQKHKIELAGRGDVKRLLQRAETLKMRFKTCDQLQTVDQLRDWATDLSTESQSVRTNLTCGTFVHGSLFAKTLNAVLTPEQSAKLDRRLFNPVAPSSIQGGGFF